MALFFVIKFGWLGTKLEWMALKVPRLIYLCKHGMTNQRNQQKEKGWKHPPKNWVKVNFDAVIREEKITIAVVTKNKKQKLLSA